LGNEKDFVRERILDFRTGRKAAHIDQALIRSVRTFHKTGFSGNRSAIRVIALGGFGGGSRRSGGRRLRGGFGSFRWRGWIKRLLCLWILCRSGFSGRISCGLTSCRWFFLGTGRDKEPEKQCEREPQFHNLLGRSLHCFYFNASGRGIATQFAKANCQAISDLVAIMEPARKILIVDDDAGSRALLAKMLTAAGYTCREMDNATDALKLVHQEPPAVLLLDFKMPAMDGAEAVRRLRADPNPSIAQVPVIMLTGYGESEVICLQAGADDFVVKPIKIEVLRARIEAQSRLHSLRLQLQQQNNDLEEWRRNHERDLAAARATQQSLIPQKAPQLEGWEIATCYRPVIEVGGDIYGWLPINNGRWLFWIADATGHGASAALLTTLAKLLFHYGGEQRNEPAAIMKAVNDDLRGIFAGHS